MTSDASRHLLATGTKLRLHSVDEQALGEAVVVSVSEGLIWIKAGNPLIHAKDRVVMEHLLDGDARYIAPARVEFVPPETLALRRVGEWIRDQRRSEVRIRIYRTTLQVGPPPPADADEDPVSLEMLDLSAGGCSGRTRREIELGSEVLCRLDLDGEALELRAKVVRRTIDEDALRVYGFRFHQIDESRRSMLREWVLREGVRRARMKRPPSP